MIETTLELTEEQRKEFLKRTGTIPVDAVGYAWKATHGEDAEIPKKIRCTTVMELMARRVFPRSSFGGRISAKRYAKAYA